MHIKKYTYEGFDFDEALADAAPVVNDNKPKEITPEAKPESVKEVAPPAIYTEEQMQKAKELAKNEGINLGQEQARAQFLDSEAKKMESLLAIANKIEQKVAQIASETEQKILGLTENLLPLAVAAAKKANPNNLEEFIAEYLKKLSSKEKIQIFVSPQNADMLIGKFANTDVMADENLHNADFKIMWNGGYAERNLQEIWQEIENILRNETKTNNNKREEV